MFLVSYIIQSVSVTFRFVVWPTMSCCADRSKCRHVTLIIIEWFNASQSTVCHYNEKRSHTHTHPFNGPLSGTTRVSRYQKGKTNLDFTEARDSEWQWNPLGHMQVCTALQTDNHASTQPLIFYRPDALPVAQPTVSKHWRHNEKRSPDRLSL